MGVGILHAILGGVSHANGPLLYSRTSGSSQSRTRVVSDTSHAIVCHALLRLFDNFMQLHIRKKTRRLPFVCNIRGESHVIILLHIQLDHVQLRIDLLQVSCNLHVI